MKKKSGTMERDDGEKEGRGWKEESERIRINLRKKGRKENWEKRGRQKEREIVIV